MSIASLINIHFETSLALLSFPRLDPAAQLVVGDKLVLSQRIPRERIYLVVEERPLNRHAVNRCPAWPNSHVSGKPSLQPVVVATVLTGQVDRILHQHEGKRVKELVRAFVEVHLLRNLCLRGRIHGGDQLGKASRDISPLPFRCERNERLSAEWAARREGVEEGRGLLDSSLPARA